MSFNRLMLASGRVTKVQDVETGVKGTVADMLSTQFTVVTEGGKVRFYFYNDKDVTWTEVKE